MTFSHQLTYPLSAPPKRVMEMLTNPTLIRKWCGSEGEIPAVKGAAMHLFDNWATGTVTEAEENKLVFTWRVSEWDSAIPDTTVAITLTQEDTGTLLHLKHSNFVSEEECNSHKTGWTDYVLDPLEDYLLLVEKY